MSTAAQQYPRGPVAAALANLRTALANCHYWRTWEADVRSIEEAAARIYTTVAGYYPAAIDPKVGELTKEQYARILPYILLYKGDTVDFTHVAEPAGHIESGTLVATIAAAVPDRYLDRIPDAIQQHDNLVGLIISSGDVGKPGLYELAQQPGFLQLKDVAVEGPHEHTHEFDASRPREIWSTLTISWGPDT